MMTGCKTGCMPSSAHSCSCLSLSVPLTPNGHILDRQLLWLLAVVDAEVSILDLIARPQHPDPLTPNGHILDRQLSWLLAVGVGQVLPQARLCQRAGRKALELPVEGLYERPALVFCLVFRASMSRTRDGCSLVAEPDPWPNFGLGLGRMAEVYPSVLFAT
eukprot:465174-Pelagomonas_calceolata.AAC.6